VHALSDACRRLGRNRLRSHTDLGIGFETEQAMVVICRDNTSVDGLADAAAGQFELAAGI
jgi:hypothetical protein